MLRYSFDLDKEARAIEDATLGVINDGWRTFDIAQKGENYVGTAEMGRLIRERIV